MTKNRNHLLWNFLDSSCIYLWIDTWKRGFHNRTCTLECRRSWSGPSNLTGLHTSSSTSHTSTSSRHASGWSASWSRWGRQVPSMGRGARTSSQGIYTPSSWRPPCCSSAGASTAGYGLSGGAAGSGPFGSPCCISRRRTCSSPWASLAIVRWPLHLDLSYPHHIWINSVRKQHVHTCGEKKTLNAMETKVELNWDKKKTKKKIKIMGTFSMHQLRWNFCLPGVPGKFLFFLAPWLVADLLGLGFGLWASSKTPPKVGRQKGSPDIICIF